MIYIIGIFFCNNNELIFFKSFRCLFCLSSFGFPVDGHLTNAAS